MTLYVQSQTMIIMFQVDPNDFEILGCKALVVFLKTVLVGLLCFLLVVLVVVMLLVVSGNLSLF